MLRQIGEKFIKETIDSNLAFTMPTYKLQK